MHRAARGHSEFLAARGRTGLVSGVHRISLTPSEQGTRCTFVPLFMELASIRYALTFRTCSCSGFHQTIAPDRIQVQIGLAPTRGTPTIISPAPLSHCFSHPPAAFPILLFFFPLTCFRSISWSYCYCCRRCAACPHAIHRTYSSRYLRRNGCT